MIRTKENIINNGPQKRGILHVTAENELTETNRSTVNGAMSKKT